MTKRLEQPKRIINTWTTHHLGRMEELIEEAYELHLRVDWREHLVELGHSLNAVRTMASTIYKRRLAEKNRGELNILRALADGIESPEVPKVGRPRKPLPKPPGPTPADIFSHGIATPLSRLIFEAEIRDKVQVQGLTGAQFGDPLPGRSALDRRMAGFVEPQVRQNGMPFIPKKVTLAMKPMRGTTGLGASPSSIRAPARSKPTAQSRRTDDRTTGTP